MKVILQEEVNKLGSTGDVVEVADGFGRNYLLPRSLAVLADERNTNRLEHQKRIASARQARVTAEARAVAEKVTGSAVSFKRQGADGDKIFGSVTNQDIVEALAAQGIVVDRRAVLLADPIRQVGVFTVPVKIHRGIEANLKVYVSRP